MRTDRLTDRRNELRLTQAELAERVGVSKQTIYRYEKGMDISSDVLGQLAQALDVSADWLLGLVDDKAGTLEEASLSADERKLLDAVRNGELANAAKLAADIADANQKAKVSGVKPAPNR